jgi:LysR family transcriptional regulator, glycine cleavage system transcriptional activator
MSLPLNALKSFEAAARHLSFARAARDLGVQPPAVSRQVAGLEQRLGVDLFQRSKPRLLLTPPGQDLFASVSAGFNEIRTAFERIQQQPTAGTLKVVTSIGFASCWLLARLPEFHKRYPDIELRLETRDSTSNYITEDADVSVAFGNGELPGVEVRNIFISNMMVVCSPGYLPAERNLQVEELADHKLLHYDEPTHRDDWRRLFASQGLALPDRARSQGFNSFVVYLQAALNGDGIAIGWECLLDDLIANGKLRRASALSLESGRGYYCYLQQRAAQNPDARKFLDWIISVGHNPAQASGGIEDLPKL